MFLVLPPGLEPELQAPQTRVLTNYTKVAWCLHDDSNAGPTHYFLVFKALGFLYPQAANIKLAGSVTRYGIVRCSTY